MNKFKVNDDLFGGLAYIKTGRDVHVYKIVTNYASNNYCDVPIKWDAEPYMHDKIVPVLNVIHCGVDESRVIRVAVDDCEKIITPQERLEIREE